MHPKNEVTTRRERGGKGVGAGLFRTVSSGRKGREREVRGSSSSQSGPWGKNVTQSNPRAQTPRWRSHEEEGKKRPLGICMGAVEANFLDLVPHSSSTRLSVPYLW